MLDYPPCPPSIGRIHWARCCDLAAEIVASHRQAEDLAVVAWELAEVSILWAETLARAAAAAD